MRILANFALALTVAVFVVSAGPLPAAAVLSMPAALIAVAAIRRGYIRRGFLTLYLAAGAIFVSPLFTDLQRVDIWMLILAAAGGVLGVVLYLDYRRRARRHRR